MRAEAAAVVAAPGGGRGRARGRSGPGCRGAVLLEAARRGAWPPPRPWTAGRTRRSARTPSSAAPTRGSASGAPESWGEGRWCERTIEGV